MKTNLKKDPVKAMLSNSSTNTFKEKESIVFWALIGSIVLFLFFKVMHCLMEIFKLLKTLFMGLLSGVRFS